MAITFKPLENKSESWNENEFVEKLNKLAEADLGGRKVKIGKNLTTATANIFQKMVWSVAKHSNLLRKWVLGVHVDSSSKLLTKMGKFINETPELKNNPQLTTSYNNAVSEYNKFIQKNTGKKTARKYAATPLGVDNSPSNGKKTPSKKPATEFKHLRNALIEHLEANKTKYGSRAARHFKKIEADFDAAKNLDDFLLKLAHAETGTEAILSDKIDAIKKFLINSLNPSQPTLLTFKQTKTEFFKYLEQNKESYGSTKKLQSQRIVRIKADFEQSANLEEFTDNMRKKPYRIIEEKIGEIEVWVLGSMGSPKEASNPKNYLPIANRPFGPKMTKNVKTHYENYPTAPITQPLKDIQALNPSLLDNSQDKYYKGIYSKIHSLEEYEASFVHIIGDKMRGKLKQKGHEFNIHDIQFQNLALHFTNEMSYQEIIGNQNKSPALLQLIRARNYAIATRRDVSWSGHTLTEETDKKQKQLQMEANWRSLVLYDWGGVPSSDFDKTPGNEKTVVSVTQDDTLTALEKMSKSYNSTKIAWINMANAHRTGGGYQQGDKAQEEMTVTNSDGIGVLGNVSEILSDGRAGYKKHLHIPPGGNYFHQTVVFTTSDYNPILCNSIVHAFADFRSGTYSNLSEFDDYSKNTKLDSSSQAYTDRIKLDMRGVLRTAKQQGQEALILSATGCGAFRHDPKAEAKGWSEVLMEPEFKGHFKEIVFAIKHDKRNSGNFDAFKPLANLTF